MSSEFALRGQSKDRTHPDQPMMSMKIYFRALYVSCLLTIFLIGFGIPNLRKYLQDDSLVVFSKEFLTNPIQAPAITICPINQNTGFGLKTKSFKSNETFLHNSCGSGETDIENCIMKQTYSLKESVPNIAFAGRYLELSETFGHFSSDISCIRCGWGQCHTLEENITILTFGKIDLGPLTFALNKSLHFDIFFHDKKFFYISMNPGITPGFRLSFTKGENLVNIVSVKLVNHIKRNTVANPCHEDTEYSFIDCIREKIEDKVGCLLPWRPKNNGNLENCKTIEKFEYFEEIFYDINDQSPIDVANEYDCKIPCEYKEFVFVEDLPTQLTFNSLKENYKILQVVLSTREVLVKREVQLYGLTSLVGDTGGSLGLFLGFSFFMFWDWALAMTDFIKIKLVF